MTPQLQRRVLRYMVERGSVAGHAPGDDFWACLRAARVLRVDLLLCLLRLDELPLAEVLLGHAIVRCPPCVARCRPPQPPRGRAATGDLRVVLRAAQPAAREGGARRFLHKPLYARLALLRPGTTVEHAVARGLRRGDLRLALRRGYVELSR